jgi:excisionase family DNA binding protein
MLPPDFAEYLTPSQAARLLDISSDRIRQLVHEERLVALETPLGNLIFRPSAEEYLRTRSTRGKSRAV